MATTDNNKKIKDILFEELKIKETFEIPDKLLTKMLSSEFFISNMS